MLEAKSSAAAYQLRAKQAGLRYISDFDVGIKRQRSGRGFRYLLPSGKALRSPAIRQRIRGLAIPPAWESVWICPQPSGHIQATGFDEAGRRQYIYHPKWHEASSADKFKFLHDFAEVLPRLRRRVRRDLRQKKLTRPRVLAAVVRVLDKAHIRIGNEEYARKHNSRGVTTLLPKHVAVEDLNVSLSFPGKSGQQCDVVFTDRDVAKVIERCEKLESEYLFSYRDADGTVRPVGAADVNGYLREIAGEGNASEISAKDLRTWWGSVTCLQALADYPEDLSDRESKRAVVEAVKTAAEVLGNTPAVCRRSYIHPLVIESFEAGELPSQLKSIKRRKPPRELTNAEHVFAELIKS